MTRRLTTMNGILIVDKPEGPTSADIVRVIKRRVRVKVGHLGTLDPFASGILPVCLGEGTKIAQFLNTADKTYTGVIRLGQATDSGDRTVDTHVRRLRQRLGDYGEAIETVHGFGYRLKEP